LRHLVAAQDADAARALAGDGLGRKPEPPFDTAYPKHIFPSIILSLEAKLPGWAVHRDWVAIDFDLKALPEDGEASRHGLTEIIFVD
jgi:hypothetical protein